MGDSQYFQTEPRTGLLKDYIRSRGFPETTPQMKRDMGAFADMEPGLIKQGHEDKYALIFKGKLFGISDDEMALLGSLEKEHPEAESCYCDKIGGDDPLSEMPKIEFTSSAGISTIFQEY